MDGLEAMIRGIDELEVRLKEYLRRLRESRPMPAKRLEWMDRVAEGPDWCPSQAPANDNRK